MLYFIRYCHYLITGVAGGVQLLHLVGFECDTPRAQERDGTIEKKFVPFKDPMQWRPRVPDLGSWPSVVVSASFPSL